MANKNRLLRAGSQLCALLLDKIYKITPLKKKPGDTQRLYIADNVPVYNFDLPVETSRRGFVWKHSNKMSLFF